MVLSVADTQIAVENLQTRMPFAFGSVTIHALPHLIVELSVKIDGEEIDGIASDHAVPKWFRKEPDKSVADDIEDILAAAEHACTTAEEITAETAFDFWYQVYEEQVTWASERELPPLLASFGVTFVERAVIDAVCRHESLSFAQAVHENVFGIEPERIYPSTAGMEPGDALPDNPRRSIAVRHTVGMADPLTREDVDDPIDDGLPETLEEYIETDGIQYFKCKLGGDPVADADRLKRIADVIDGSLPEYGVTLDANEQYRTIADLKQLWTEIASRPSLARFADNLVCIEQPLDRELALSAAASEMLDGWRGPPIIVDESDGEIDAFETALDTGYDGTSVKSCKGVFKGLVNACLADRKEAVDGRSSLLTGEDLTTIGPVSLQEDLALMATIGFDHVERNGHHYFRGAEAYPAAIQDQLVENHGDLYRQHERGFAALDISGGTLQLDSVVAAPYGRAVDIDLSRFTPVAEWSVASLGLNA
jgi:hypothetical protein